MHLKRSNSKRAIQKIVEATGDLIWLIKSQINYCKISRTSPQNNSETATNEAQNIRHDKEIPKLRYISQEQIQKISDDLKLI